jgi:uncharacterized protein YoaH (UPF0181 family)
VESEVEQQTERVEQQKKLLAKVTASGDSEVYDELREKVAKKKIERGDVRNG